MTKQISATLKAVQTSLRKFQKKRSSNSFANQRPGSFFFKTSPGGYAAHDKFMGVTNPQVRSIAKDHSCISLSDIGTLLDSDFNEERLLALIILDQRYTKKSTSEAERLQIYEFYISKLSRVNNWNLVDCSARIIGYHLQGRSKDILINLAQSECLWKRRIAVVSTHEFIRKKDFEWTYKLVEMLLDDTHDLIHKACGWMLREAGKGDDTKLLSFLEKFATIMPRTMLRYSIEKLSVKQKKYYMEMKKKGS
jgi:3-methyladenine DNA glycosylase AlkD